MFQFPHDVDYIIKVEVNTYGKPFIKSTGGIVNFNDGGPIALIYTGNSQGEVFIYRVANVYNAFQDNEDDEAPL